MPRTKQRYRYVVEILVETDRKWPKGDVRRWLEDAMVNDTFVDSGITKTRVRKCGLIHTERPRG